MFESSLLFSWVSNVKRDHFIVKFNFLEEHFLESDIAEMNIDIDMNSFVNRIKIN